NTGLIAPLPARGNDFPELKFSFNNHADTGGAVGKGVLTGLTFGAAGSMVTDFYDLQVEYSRSEWARQSRSYQHAMYTTIGNRDGPTGLEPLPTQSAADRIVEQLVLTALRDLQTAGELK